jgi:uncharacterized protein (DUF952 family)
MDPIAYKLLLGPEMEALEREGRFDGAPVDLADGYVHMSTAAQVDETARRYFADIPDVHIVAIDLDALGEALIWEPSRGGDLFPHLYGPLTIEAVIAYGPVEYDDQGAMRLPVAG